MRKNIFKTTVIAMAVLTAAFGMTACGNKKVGNTDATQVKQEQPSVVIIIIQLRQRQAL